MKKFIIIVSVLVALYFLFDAAFYRLGIYIDLDPDAPVTTFTDTDNDQIYLDRGNGLEPFEIKGVNMGSGMPGEWSTDFAIDKEMYLRWFGQMKAMGANTLRIYTVQSQPFYDAFYEYNKDNPDPLYLIHGVWVNDYIQNSHRDAYDPDLLDAFLDDCRTMIDVVHGNKKLSLGRMTSAGHGSYLHDISPWVIGYILGVEWEDVTVVYTDRKYELDASRNQYSGTYMYTSPDATPFEAFLARVGDKVIEYESNRYKTQRLIAFSNWPTTDPFDYPLDVTRFFMKCAKVDVEHILTTDAFLSGQFASYHVYPYYPDYLSYVDDWSIFGLGDRAFFYNGRGELNTYRAYLSMLTAHHASMPVVISEFGVSTGRGMAQRDMNTGRNQGNMAEHEQGYALVDCYYDITEAGCAGCCVFAWQDEWFKRTWNTMYAVDLTRNPYWSDYQTNEQYFGLLSFDPGTTECISYVDGDLSEWTQDDIVHSGPEGSISMKYDEKFIYFLINTDQDPLSRTLYIPLDITPKTGSTYCENYSLLFDRAADFLIVLNGRENSRVQVQERYESLRSTHYKNIYDIDTYVTGNQPDATSPLFVNIDMILQTATPLIYHDNSALAEVYETGLLTYGNANPDAPDYNSLADFICSGNAVELKLPWQLLNFSDPSRMQVHDDYFSGNYGVEHLRIESIYVGLGTGSSRTRIHLDEVEMVGWQNKVTYHERLKPSYYIMQDLWADNS